MNLRSILTGKCPICAKGKIFHTFWQMNNHCPVCETHFYREAGYFSMSIFIGYMLAGVIGLPFLILALLAGWGQLGVLLAPSIVILLSAPWIFRYARIVWIHFDEWIDPRQTTQ